MEKIIIDKLAAEQFWKFLLLLGEEELVHSFQDLCGGKKALDSFGWNYPRDWERMGL